MCFTEACTDQCSTNCCTEPVGSISPGCDGDANDTSSLAPPEMSTCVHSLLEFQGQPRHCPVLCNRMHEHLANNLIGTDRQSRASHFTLLGSFATFVLSVQEQFCNAETFRVCGGVDRGIVHPFKHRYCSYTLIVRPVGQSHRSTGENSFCSKTP